MDRPNWYALKYRIHAFKPNLEPFRDGGDPDEIVRRSPLAVYDFQLRDHFVNSNSLYAYACECALHKHNKRWCRVTEERECPRCGTATRSVLSFRSSTFHRDRIAAAGGAVYACCEHTHSPPCGACINCNVLTRSSVPGAQSSSLPCLIPEPFVCDLTTTNVCPRHPTRFAEERTSPDMQLAEHMYNTKTPSFYFCKRHWHYHRTGPRVPCVIQTFACCDSATRLRETRASFYVCGAVVCKNGSRRYESYVIFDPSIWKDQSYNYFASFLRSLISAPGSVRERYQRFVNSNFSVPHLQTYISGKDSIGRTAVTGFETSGIYQTSTISCRLPYHRTTLPQNLYDRLRRDGYDLTLGMVKRDPSIKTTCMYVCSVRRNPDPAVMTIEISDASAKGLHQDQDGDKNAEYLLRLRRPLRPNSCLWWAMDRSYAYALAKTELAHCFRSLITVLGLPRYSFSETNLINLHRVPTIRFPPGLRNRSLRFLIEALSGYRRDHFDEFFEQLAETNRTLAHHRFFTVDDLVGETDLLNSVIESGAKGSREHLRELVTRVRESRVTIHDRTSAMVGLINDCIRSSKDLSKNGRDQFAALYATSDLNVLNGLLFHNKQFVANCRTSGLIGTFLFNSASMSLCREDVMSLSPRRSV